MESRPFTQQQMMKRLTQKNCTICSLIIDFKNILIVIAAMLIFIFAAYL